MNNTIPQATQSRTETWEERVQRIASVCKQYSSYGDALKALESGGWIFCDGNQAVHHNVFGCPDGMPCYATICIVTEGEATGDRDEYLALPIAGVTYRMQYQREHQSIS